MNKPELQASLIELQKILSETNELDWFHRLAGIVNYKEIEDTKYVKADVDHVMGGLSILYLFAIFESYFKPEYWKDYVNSDKEKVLRAYRHVRHSIAHGHHGLRAQPRSPRGINQEEYDAFDEAISSNLFDPKNIIELDTSGNVITINSSVGIYLRLFMKDIIQEAISEVAKKIQTEIEASFR